jgi:hypothetical protein
MKILKFVVVGFYCSFHASLHRGFLLPSHSHLCRSMLIQATVDSIFNPKLSFETKWKNGKWTGRWFGSG